MKQQADAAALTKVSDEWGNCECPDGSVCLMTEMMEELKSINDELGYEKTTVNSLEDLTNAMKAQLGCPARSKDKMHWYTSLKYFSWRSDGVACYNMRKGDKLKNIVLYTDDEGIVHAKAGAQHGKEKKASSSVPTSRNLYVNVLLVLFAL